MCLTVMSCDEFYFSARYGARPINTWFPRFWLSVIILHFENLWEHVESRWFLQAVLSSTCAHGMGCHSSIPVFRDFYSAWYSHSLKICNSILNVHVSYSLSRVLLERMVCSFLHQFLISEILTLGHNLTLLKLLRACWKFVVLNSCE